MSKLFVATEFPPDAPGGGPAVVRQMLRDFPGEVHWWSCRGSVLGSSFMVPRGTSLQSTRNSGASFQVSSFQCCPPGKLMPAKKLPHLRAFLTEHLWAPRAARSLRETIARINPACLWLIPHNWSILPLWRGMGSRVSSGESQGVRWHVSMHDFVDAHNFGERVGSGVVRRMRRMQDLIYKNATSRDVICEPMAQHLQEQTGTPPTFICRKGLDSDHFAFLESKQVYSPPSTLDPRPRPSTPIKLAYAGTILCEPEFYFFVNLLESIIQQRTTNNEPRTPSIELHLYGAHSYASRPWFRPWIIEHGNLPENDLIVELRKCDWGLSLMALDERDPIYNRYSFPAKFCTYFSAGLAVITIGHPESSVMKMASAYNVGLTIQTRNPSREDLANALFAPDAKQIYLPEILRCAREQFDAEAMRKHLWQAFGLVSGS